MLSMRVSCVFLKESYRILIWISFKWIPDDLTDDKQILVRARAWHRVGDKPLHEWWSEFTDAWMPHPTEIGNNTRHRVIGDRESEIISPVQGWGQLRSWSWSWVQLQLQLRSWSWNWSWNLRSWSWSWYSRDLPELELELELKLPELELELIFKTLTGVGVGVGVETPGVGVGIGVETLGSWSWN